MGATVRATCATTKTAAMLPMAESAPKTNSGTAFTPGSYFTAAVVS